MEALFVGYETSVSEFGTCSFQSQVSAPSVVYLAQYGELLAFATIGQAEALDLHSTYFLPQTPKSIGYAHSFHSFR